MLPSKEKWSLYWLARHKPYWLVLLTAVMLAASFSPSPLNPIVFIALVPLFVLFETEVVPVKVPEDKIFRPFKSLFVILFRLATLQFLWRARTRGDKVLSYRRTIISGNAQLYRYSYTIFLFWNAACCYWLVFYAVASDSLQEATVNAAVGILAIVLNPALMALPWQLVARIRWVFPPMVAAFCLVPFWLAFEHLHDRWDLAWNWLRLGHALAEWPSLVQYAEWTGAAGISLHILVANLLVYWVYRRWTWFRKLSWVPVSLALAWFVVPLVLYPVLTSSSRDLLQPAGFLNVRIVQPNVDPYLKYNYFTPEEQILHMANLAQEQPMDSVDLVVLPETAIPRPHNIYGVENNRIIEPLWALVDSFQASVLLGAEEFQHFAGEEPVSPSARRAVRGGWIDQYNSAFMLRADRQLEPHRKGRLVPLVERLPFLPLVSRLDDRFQLGLETRLGNYGLPDSLVVPETGDGVAVGTAICYESVFGADLRRTVRQGAGLLAVLTNDGWWLNTSGYLQHAAIARLRAVETRRELVRSANTGQSGFVDASGHLYQATAWGEEAVIDRKVPVYQGQTFYVRHGDWLGRGAVGITILLVAVALGLFAWQKLRKPG